jgi:hypothetical protein
MLSVFDRITVWRADFDPFLPFVLLVGHKGPAPLDVERMAERVRGTGLFKGYEKTFGGLTGREMLSLYSGNLGQSAEVVGPGPINTDNRPIIEFKAPVTIRNIFAGQVRAMNGDLLHDYITGLIARTPPAADPYLAEASPADQELVLAGLALFGDTVFRKTDPERSRQLETTFFRRLKKARQLRQKTTVDETP